MSYLEYVVGAYAVFVERQLGSMFSNTLKLAAPLTPMRWRNGSQRLIGSLLDNIASWPGLISRLLR